MQKNEFYEFVRDQIRNHVDGSYNFELIDVQSSKGKYKGLVARVPGENTQINAIANLDKYYEDHVNGVEDEITLKAIAEDITSAPYDAVTDVTTYIMEWDKVKDRLFVSPVNIMKVNTTIYETVAADIVLTPRILVNNDCCSLSSAVVTAQLLAKWGVNADTVINYAKNNTKNLLGCKIIELDEFMKQLTGSENESDMPNSNAFIVTNNNNSYGAAALFLPGVIQEVSQKIGGDFYVLPSSVNELLCIPVISDDVEYLKRMVKDINNNVLQKPDILSYKVCMYDSKANELKEV